MPAGTPNGNELQYIVLDDFSPGIYDDWYAAGGAQSAPLGAAQMTGTYGCVSGKGGGLVPAPRIVNRIQENPQTAGSTDPYTHITAFKMLSPVYDRTGVASTTTGTVRPFPDQLFYSYEWYDSSGRHHCLQRAYKMYMQTAANPTLGSVTTYDLQSKQTGTGKTPLYFGFSSFDISRNNPSDPTAPGYPTVGCSFSSNRDFTVTGQIMYPNPSTGTTDSTLTMAGLNVSGGSACYAIMAHQDRMMCFQISVNFGFGTAGDVPFDGLIGTSPNDFSTNGFTVSTFVNENPGLFGSWCSVNASEAFFVKQQHGGYDVRGDVANPTVVRLPGVEPTGDAINIGVLDPSGNYIYGTVTGVWAWNAGNASTLVSPQLDGWFWKPDVSENDPLTTVDNYLYTKGQFARLGKYVHAPNNFMFDTSTGGWWRLSQPGDSGNIVYGFWDISAAGYVVGVPVYLGANQTVIADYFDPDLGNTRFLWTSQPFKATQGRVVEFRELDLVAQGQGGVQVTITGLNGATVSESFTINSPNQPVTINMMTSLQTHDAIINITSDSLSENPAPRVYRLTCGYETLMTARPEQA